MNIIVIAFARNVQEQIAIAPFDKKLECHNSVHLTSIVSKNVIAFPKKKVKEIGNKTNTACICTYLYARSLKTIR